MTTSYVTYTYYTTTFLGTVIASADFAQLALRASAVLDSITFNRVAAIVLTATDIVTIDKIKMATCAVAEELQTLALAGSSGGGIKSESLGSYSVSYADGSKMSLTDTQKLSNAASLYLGSTGLMFKGFFDDEYGEAPSDAY